MIIKKMIYSLGYCLLSQTTDLDLIADFPFMASMKTIKKVKSRHLNIDHG